MNAFFKSQFSYCSLSWMFHSRTLYYKINRLYERCLRIIYNDNTSFFTDPLEIDNSVSVHHRNIQVLATELYKFVNGLSPKLVNDCFKANNMTVYNTRNRSTIYSRSVRTVLHGTKSLSHLGSKIWELVPNDTKSIWNYAISVSRLFKFVQRCLCFFSPKFNCKTQMKNVGIDVEYYSNNTVSTEYSTRNCTLSNYCN